MAQRLPPPSDAIECGHCVLPLARRQVRIPQGHRQRAVTEQVTHGVERHAGLREERGVRVAEVVEAEGPQTGGAHSLRVRLEGARVARASGMEMTTWRNRSGGG